MVLQREKYFPRDVNFIEYFHSDENVHNTVPGDNRSSGDVWRSLSEIWSATTPTRSDVPQKEI